MMTKLLTGSALAVALAIGPSLAQTPGSTTPAQNNAKQSADQAQSSQNLPQRIRQKLQQQGFSDVKVVPGSFIVSAKDKDGDPVSMVIGPHSTMMFSVVSSDESGKSTQGTTSGQK